MSFNLTFARVATACRINPNANDARTRSEDIIGSNRYVEPIEEARTKVEALTEQRMERANRVKVVERECSSLRDSKLEAEAYLSKEREICRTRAGLLQQLAAEGDSEKAEVESKRAELQARLEKEAARLAEAAEEENALEATYKTKRGEHDAIKAEMDGWKKDYARCERQDIKLRADLKHTKEQMKKLKAAVSAAKKKGEAAKTAAEEAEASLPTLESKIAEAEEAKVAADAAHDAVHESLKGETEALRSQMAKAEAELRPLAEAAAEAKAASDTAAAELALQEERIAAAKKERADVDAAAKALESDTASQLEELRSAEVSKEKTERRLESARAELAEVVEEEKELSVKVREARSLCEEHKAAMSSASSRSRLLDSLMGATQVGGELAGVGLRGRLGDLGAIDSDYDVAVTTACPMLNSLVVETAEGGMACCDFLRRNNLGRARFIILDKIGHAAKAMSKKFKAPKGTERLFDLVRCADDDVAVAFYYTMGDTLVADNLDTATDIAYVDGECRWRIVTLAGELIDKSGTMSGGGGSKAARRGGMGSSVVNAGVTEEEAAASAGRFEELAKQLAAVRERRTGLEKEIKALQRAGPKIDLALKKLRAAVESAEERRKEIEAQRAALAASATTDEEDEGSLSQLRKDVASLRAAHAEAQAQADSVAAEVAALQKQVMDVGGKRLRKAKEAADAAKAHVSASKSALAKARATIKSSAKAVESAATAGEKAAADKTKAEEKYKTTQEALERLTADATEVIESMAASEKTLKAKAAEVAALETDFARLKKVVAKVRAVEVEIRAELENYDAVVGDVAARTAGFSSQIEALRAEYATFFADEAPTEASGDDAAASPSDGGSEEAKDGAQEDDKDEVESRELRLLTADELALPENTKAKLEWRVSMLEGERDELRSNVNMGAIADYRKKDAEFRARVKDLDEVSSQRDRARRVFEALRKKRLEEFHSGFSVITSKLKEMYQMITLGGDAELDLVDSLDPFAEGIVFSVRPPKKSWKNISNLSGGEKTLSSLALVFALHHYRPTPLYVMDEIDAALDFKNVSIVAHYIKERTRNAQFVIISLRNNMFELADRLVGIYKTDDITNSVSINPHTFSLPAAGGAGKAGSSKGAAAPSAPAPALSDRTNRATR